MKKNLLFTLKLLFISSTILVTYRVFFVTDQYWSGIYYPNGNSTGNAIYSSHFQNKEECIGWAINERGLRPEDKDVPQEDLWECNMNCRLAPEYAILVNSTQEYKQELLDENRGPLYVCDDGGFDGGDWLRGEVK